MKYLPIYIYTASKSSFAVLINAYTTFMAALTYACVFSLTPCLLTPVFAYTTLLLFVGIGVQLARHGCKIAGIAINFDIE